MKLFLDSDNKLITSDKFISELSSFIDYGDIVYIEMDLMSFGKLYDLNTSKEDFLNCFYEIFRKLVGYEGHICVPSFSYSWGMDKSEMIFDLNKTKGKVGIFPEFFRHKEGTYRTLDPMFSVLINGPKAKELSLISNSSFGKKSFFEMLHKKNAKLMSFGLNKYDPTFVHYIEEFFDNNIERLNYRKLKKFTGFFIENHKKIKKEHFVFARDLNSNLTFDHQKLLADLKIGGKLDSTSIGSGIIQISDCDSVFDTSISGMKKNLHYLVS